MALPRSWLSLSSTLGHLGLAITLLTAHFIWSAKPLSTGLSAVSSGDSSSDVRGGSKVLPLLLKVHCATFSGWERNSSHFHVASWFFPPLKSTRLSPAIVVAQPADPSGSGAAAHLPLIFGNSPSRTPANHAPAMYMATFPVANATRPSYEFELRKSFGEYFARST